MESELPELSTLYCERSFLRTDIGRLWAEIWRLEKLPATAATIDVLNEQIQSTALRVEAVDSLINRKRLQLAGQ